MPTCCRAWRRELSIQVAVSLYYIGETMAVMTALPYIVYGVCRDVLPHASPDFCIHLYQHPVQEIQVQKDSALYLMTEKMLGTVPPLLLAVFFGPWSDVHGRKVPLLLPLAGSMVSVLLFLLAHYLPQAPVVLLVMAGFLARALSGSYILVHLISSSYVADLVWATGGGAGTYQEIGGRESRTRGRGGGRGRGLSQAWSSRTYEETEGGLRGGEEGAGGPSSSPGDQGQFLAAMSRLQVAESLGAVLGSFLSWCLQRAGGAPLAFLAAMGVLAVGMVVVVCCVEDLPRPRARAQLEAASTGGGGLLRRCWGKTRRMLTCQRLDIDPVLMWGCVLAMFFMFACREGRATVTPIFIQQPPLSWPNERLSAYMAAYSAFHSLFLFLVAPLLTERTVVLVSLLCSLLGGAWMGLAFTTWAMMLAGCLSHMTDCIFPALRAVLCRHLRQDQVGKGLSRLSTAEALSSLAGPLAMTALYNSTADYFPGTSFLATAAIPAAVLLVGVGVEVCYHPAPPRPGPPDHPPDLDPREAQRPDFTQSLNVPSATVSGYGFMWSSAQW